MIDIRATDSAVWLFVHGDASQQQFLRCDRKAQKNDAVDCRGA